jgi:hypothetical protein
MKSKCPKVVLALRTDRLVSEHTFKNSKKGKSSNIVPLLLKLKEHL